MLPSAMMVLVCLLALACVLPTVQLEGVQVKLELDDACWFYKEEERALTCTVNNFKDAISWKKDDWLIGFDGAPFGRNTHLYNITTNTTDTVRQEKLRIDSVIALNLTREQTGFLCQNHDHDSQTIKLSIPDHSTCRRSSKTCCAKSYKNTKPVGMDIPVVQLRIIFRDFLTVATCGVIVAFTTIASGASLVRMSHFIKKAFWKLASIMKEEGRLPDEDLLFYFTNSELDTLLKTRSAKLIARAQRRRRISTLQQKFEFPLLNKGYPVPIVESDELADSNTKVSLKMQGTPVSRGSIRGIARVILSVEQAHSIEAGDILVVQATDVGWSPYFPLLSGLVTEIGSMLSHGVVVAREYGIPCVVNIRKATAIFKTGDMLVLNGAEGTVERLEQ